MDSHGQKLESDRTPKPIESFDSVWAAAISARYLALGVTGRLNPVSTDKIKSTLKSINCPVADALLARAAEMEKTGWRFGNWPLPPLHINYVKRVYYSAPPLCIWTGNRLSYATNVWAHEVAHHDGINMPSAHDWRLEAEARMVQETRAMLTELHISDHIGEPPYPETSRRDLGRYLHRIYSHNNVSRWPSSDEASLFVRNYIQRTFGANIVSSEGRIRAFDINAGSLPPRLRPEVETEWRNFVSHTPKIVRATVKAIDAATLFAATKSGSYTIGSLRTAAAAGVFMWGSDLPNAFREDKVHGFARIAKIACAWGGFELGSRVLLPFLRRKIGLFGAVLGTTTLGWGVGTWLGAEVGSWAEASIISRWDKSENAPSQRHGNG